MGPICYSSGELISQFGQEGLNMKKAPKAMTNVVSALTARKQFGQIMRRASAKNERFLVDRRGEPSVIIMSVNDYMATFAPEPGC